MKTLRDTGCSGVVVKKDLVRDDQFTGKMRYILLIDKMIQEVPLIKLQIDTPYLKGEVEAQCFPDAIYDLIIGNVEGAREPNDPDPQWQLAVTVMTRQQTKKANKPMKPLKVMDPGSDLDTKDKLVELQKQDSSLMKFREIHNPKLKGNYEVRFEEREGILYRLYQNLANKNGEELRQVFVPESLLYRVRELAHCATMGGHLGTKKTSERVTNNFYWPGIYGDVSRFCRSCDICQKTIPKGKVRRILLEKMPLINTPFKRVAVDLIGPIYPPSDAGHRYILTLVDYATRYPDALPLKSIGTEDVAEALVDIYSKLGIPEEILSDLGTQLISECMKEVSRLLSMKQLTTSPYHPMCNGLTEKFNGTLKRMLTRMCNEQPRQWHRYINPLLFAYREVPQESTGFSPFELMYGRTVRGPMRILKELWTQESQETEVKTSY